MGTQKSHKLRKKVRFLPPLPNIGKIVDDFICEVRTELYLIGNAFFTVGWRIGVQVMFERIGYYLNRLIDLTISMVCFGTYLFLFLCAMYALVDTIGGYGWITYFE